MKTTTKRILSLVLAAIFVASALALSACKPVKSAVKIGVPDDATNLARAIKLLESAGFIEVDPAAGYSPELKDITNEKIDLANKWIEQLAEEYGLKYLHTNPTLKGEDGYLIQSYQNGDGLHMQQSGFKVILNYIRTHGYPKN